MALGVTLTIYSLLGSCRRLGTNPAEYLQAVFKHLPKAKTPEVKSLTPAAWAKTQRMEQGLTS